MLDQKFDNEGGIPEDLVTDPTERANAIATGSLSFLQLGPYRLCKRCSKVITVLKPRWKQTKHFLEETPRRSKVRHHVNVSELIASAQKGCHFCALFSDGSHEPGIHTDDVLSSEYHVDVIDYGERRLTGDRVTLTLSLDNPIEDAPTFLRGFELLPCKRIDPPIFLPVSTWKTDSNATMKLIQQWTETCMLSHRRCIARVESTSPPRRLIEISCKDDQLAIRLRKGEDLDFGVRYVCLSHCWGSGSVLNLTRENERPFRQAIELYLLPQTFLDAVAVTWRLGYRFLWIDSLCIIQDCNDDWSDQIPFMGEIYRQSVLTIAASKAHNSNGGLFTTRSPLAHSYCRLPQIDPKEWLAGLPHFQPGEEGPLLGRAWVIQERALAPRTVSFGSIMVHWECSQCTASEGEPEFKDSWIAQAPLRSWEKRASKSDRIWWHGPWDPRVGGIKTNFAKMLATSKTGGYQSLQAYWWDLVETYTACSLTYNSDKIAAFTGIIDEAKQACDITLVHGM